MKKRIQSHLSASSIRITLSRLQISITYLRCMGIWLRNKRKSDFTPTSDILYSNIQIPGNSIVMVVKLAVYMEVPSPPGPTLPPQWPSLPSTKKSVANGLPSTYRKTTQMQHFLAKHSIWRHLLGKLVRPWHLLIARSWIIVSGSRLRALTRWLISNRKSESDQKYHQKIPIKVHIE